ncbi:MAG: hypothetical protein FWC80_05525 [Firmicutes bacterium]|nr:hypothetical protein [Bacillota bacterium]
MHITVKTRRGIVITTAIVAVVWAGLLTVAILAVSGAFLGMSWAEFGYVDAFDRSSRLALRVIFPAVISGSFWFISSIILAVMLYSLVSLGKYNKIIRDGEKVQASFVSAQPIIVRGRHSSGHRGDYYVDVIYKTTFGESNTARIYGHIQSHDLQLLQQAAVFDIYHLNGRVAISNETLMQLRQSNLEQAQSRL